MDEPSSLRISEKIDSTTLPIRHLTFKASGSIEEGEEEQLEISSEQTNSAHKQTDLELSPRRSSGISTKYNNNNNNDNSIDRCDGIRTANQSNLEESAIKVKRCKHGRIIIKDHSKKRLTHRRAENDSMIVTNQTTESNDHVSDTPKTVNSVLDANRISSPMTKSGEPSVLSEQSKGKHKAIEPAKKQSMDNGSPNSYKDASELDRRPAQSSKDQYRREDEALPSSRRFVKSNLNSPRGSRARSDSRSRSYSRSPARERDSSIQTNSARDRSRSKSNVHDSNSRRNKNRDRRSRRKVRMRGHREKNISRSDRQSPIRSPKRRRRSYSRSISPNRDIVRRRQDTSRSPERSQYASDRYSTQTRTRLRRRDVDIEREYKRSPDRGRSTDDDNSRVSLNLNDSYSRNKIEDSRINRSSLGELLSATRQKQEQEQLLLLQQQQQQQQKEQQQQELLQTKPQQQQSPPDPQCNQLLNLPKLSSSNDAKSPCEPTPTLQSPITPLNDDSASSDVYDPAGPLIPMSPVESPPVSPPHDCDPSLGQKQEHKPLSPPPVANRKDGVKLGDDDDVIPSSAVQLNQQEKYLQKLNRQERVIEEVKMALKPFYSDRAIDKEQYKDVLRRAVPKICHNRNGEINPIKIRSLVEAYIKKMKRHRF